MGRRVSQLRSPSNQLLGRATSNAETIRLKSCVSSTVGSVAAFTFSKAYRATSVFLLLSATCSQIGDQGEEHTTTMNGHHKGDIARCVNT
jgi:hypothetical protein